MYFYEPSIEGFVVRDESRNTVARVAVEDDAREIVAALNLVNAMAEQFPGLKGDEKDKRGELIEQEVDGADLVDFIVARVEWDEDGRFHEGGEKSDIVWRSPLSSNRASLFESLNQSSMSDEFQTRHKLS
jgi:hypothetical protein